MTDRPEWIRCGKCGGVVYAPRAGQSAVVVGRVIHVTNADPENPVVPCAKCGRLYELRVA